MSNLIKVYEAPNEAVAEMIREQLEEADIRATIDPIAAPLDGLTSMGQGTQVFVMDDDGPKARQVIDQWLQANPEHDYRDDEEEA
jgi:hypothetical protein